MSGVEVLQWVEATCDMALKTGNNPLTSTEKEENIVTETIHFLSSESDACSLLHFGCFCGPYLFNKFAFDLKRHFRSKHN